ncbi:MAG TPA: flagellar motor protein MotB [Epulopiscium sp.]|nr:flagellar motor protein MotB [Candidatus Epulonipiscium sp.]
MSKKVEEVVVAPGAPAYMNTYGDMMTLLLVFFVLLFAMSNVDMEKYKAFASAFDGGSGVLQSDPNQGGGILIGDGMTQLPGIENSAMDGQEEKDKAKRLQAMEKEIKEHLEKNNIAQKVETSNNGDYITIKFDDILLFDLGKAKLKPGAADVLDKVGDLLVTYLEEPQLKLAFEGHTDNIPINTTQFPSNWELSAARAIAVAKFYIEEMNFNPSQISTEGLGEYVPIESNNTAEGRATNRRVEIKIINEPKR